MLNNSFFAFTIGRTGKRGNDGAQGLPGRTGEKGDKGNGVSGVNYVRWGRTECPGNATLVYSGKKEITWLSVLKFYLLRLIATGIHVPQNRQGWT